MFIENENVRVQARPVKGPSKLPMQGLPERLVTNRHLRTEAAISELPEQIQPRKDILRASTQTPESFVWTATYTVEKAGMVVTCSLDQ